MADENHLEILKQGVEAWNQWLRDTLEIHPDLSEADLSRADLRKANLSGANLSGADFRHARLRGADLRGADLRNADLLRADLRGVDLRQAVLSEADLRETDLNGTHLNGARLYRTTLSRVDLRGAYLSGAYLIRADLSGAYLSGVDLSGAIYERVNFSNANLSLARLLGANLNGATLTEAHLWETQRTGWSIKGVVCESVYWDKEGKELTTYGPGEFERLYAEKVKVLVRYPEGISPLEVVTLPALIQHLEASRPSCKLRFESIQDGPGGAVVTIVVEETEDTSPAQTELLRAEIQAEAEQKAVRLREALESEKASVLLLGTEVRRLEWMVDKLLSRPTFYLRRGDANVGDQYNVGQAGAVGPNAHAHDMTFNQIGGNIERRMELSALASELMTLREAMSREAQETGHYIVLGEVAKAEEAAKANDSSKVAEITYA